MSWEDLEKKLDGPHAGTKRADPTDAGYLPLRQYRRQKREQKRDAERKASRAVRKEVREARGREEREAREAREAGEAGKAGKAQLSGAIGDGGDGGDGVDSDDSDVTEEDRINSGLVDLEDLGDFVQSHAIDTPVDAGATSSEGAIGGGVGVNVALGAVGVVGIVGRVGEEKEGKEALNKKARVVREMVTPLQYRSLTKEGYKIIGTHSAVKICRWTKNHLRGRGGCYKHTM